MNRTPTHASPAQRGFSLLELLLVVLILGIVAGVAAMSASDSSAQRLDLAALQVQDTVERAQALARSQRLAHGVVFDVAGDRLAVIDEDGAMAIDPITKQDFLVEFTSPGQPQGIDITAATFGDAGSAALFDAQGQPISGGSVVLTHGDQSVTLVLDGATGLMQ